MAHEASLPWTIGRSFCSYFRVQPRRRSSLRPQLGESHSKGNGHSTWNHCTQIFKGFQVQSGTIEGFFCPVPTAFEEFPVNVLYFDVSVSFCGDIIITIVAFFN